MFYTENCHSQLRAALRAAGLREMRYRFDFEGTKVMANLTDGTIPNAASEPWPIAAARAGSGAAG